MGITLAFGALYLASPAAAQSTASFPAPPGSPPAPSNRPPAPVQLAPPAVQPTTPYQPPPAVAPPPLTPPPPQVQLPPPNRANALDNRYPVLPRSEPAPALSSLGFAPPVLPFESGMPIPPGYHEEHRYANGLILGGLFTVGIAYAAGLIGSGGGSNGLGWLAVPVVGPWGAMASRKFSCDNNPLEAPNCVKQASKEVRTMALLSADAVVQATGAVLFFVGLGSGHDELVRNDRVSLRLTPRSVAEGGIGLDLSGGF